MKSKILKTLSIVCAFCLIISLAGCSKGNTESLGSSSSAVSTDDTASGENESGNGDSNNLGGGSKPKISTVFTSYDGVYPVITFKNLAEKSGYTARVVFKDLTGKTVFEQDGIKENSFTVKANLENGKNYDLFVYYKNELGDVSGLLGGIDKQGMRVRFVKKDPTQSKYYFDGAITLDTLNNYLNRVSTYCQFFQPDEDFEMIKKSITGIGAKYVQRAACSWPPGSWEHKIQGTIKNRVAEIHKIDPEVIFEACIFECVDKRVEEIAIPAVVFEKFGLKPEVRNFDLEKMMFPDGSYKNQWGTGAHVPDITQVETQMFFYYRATFFIDLGFEALHLGQANLIGKNDTGNKCWTKVIKMMRDYAKVNARRHYVIIDCHYPSQKFVGSDGVMLVDFNAFPMRINVAKGQKNHKPSEKNPQLCTINPGSGDAVYQKGIQGISPSGWRTDKYPYLVEIDNWGVDTKNLHKAGANIWGYDEITWFASQPQWYRQKFIEDLTKQIDSFNENGHLSLPTKRWIGKVPDVSESTCYYAFSYGDLDFYKDMWNRLKK